MVEDGKFYREYYYEHPEIYITLLLNGTYDYSLYAAEAYSEYVLHEYFMPLGGDQYGVAAQALQRLAESVKNGGSWDPVDVLILLGVLYGATGGGEFGNPFEGPFKIEGRLAEIWDDPEYFEGWLHGNLSLTRKDNPLTYEEALQLLANAERLGITLDLNPVGLAGLEQKGMWKDIPHFKIGDVHIPVRKGFWPWRK